MRVKHLWLRSIQPDATISQGITIAAADQWEDPDASLAYVFGKGSSPTQRDVYSQAEAKIEALKTSIRLDTLKLITYSVYSALSK